MARNKHIRPADVQGIVSIIRNWSDEKMTWDAVCDESELILGYRPGRQGLSAHAAVQEAFSARKSGLKGDPPPRTALPSSLAAAAHRLASKDAEIREVKLLNEKLNEQFAIWLYSATVVGKLTLDQLNLPPPVIDRQRTGGKK